MVKIVRVNNGREEKRARKEKAPGVKAVAGDDTRSCGLKLVRVNDGIEKKEQGWRKCREWKSTRGRGVPSGLGLLLGMT